jgi:hypothetical protein
MSLEVLVPIVRIERAVPEGPVTTAREPLPIIATIRWHVGPPSDVPAIATAWTRKAVRVTWTDHGGDEHSDWLPAVDIRRPDGTRRAQPGDDQPARPRLNTRHRPSW